MQRRAWQAFDDENGGPCPDNINEITEEQSLKTRRRHWSASRSQQHRTSSRRTNMHRLQHLLHPASPWGAQCSRSYLAVILSRALTGPIRRIRHRELSHDSVTSRATSRHANRTSSVPLADQPRETSTSWVWRRRAGTSRSSSPICRMSCAHTAQCGNQILGWCFATRCSASSMRSNS